MGAKVQGLPEEAGGHQEGAGGHQEEAGNGIGTTGI